MLGALRAAGVAVEEAALQRPSLDDVFFALTAEGDGLAEVDNAGTAGAVLEGAR